MRMDVKTVFGKMMNFVMLSCEEASLLMTQKRLVGLNLRKKLQLKMHLLSCKLCRRYDVQNEFIQHEWTSFQKENAQLSEKKKEEINSNIEAELEETP